MDLLDGIYRVLCPLCNKRTVPIKITAGIIELCKYDWLKDYWYIIPERACCQQNNFTFTASEVEQNVWILGGEQYLQACEKFIEATGTWNVPTPA